MRHRSQVVGANTVLQRNMLPVDRIVTYRGMASSFRTIGIGATTQGVFNVRNSSASAVYVAIRRLSVQMDATAALLTVAPLVVARHYTGNPTFTGGSAITKVPFDSALASSAEVLIRGATAVDGTSGDLGPPADGSFVKAWQQWTMRMHTTTTTGGQVRMPDQSLIPSLARRDPVVLRPGVGEALYVFINAVNAADNPNTNNWILNVAWEEYTL